MFFFFFFIFFFNDTATTEIYTLSLHDALPIYMEDNKIKEMALENKKILQDYVDTGKSGAFVALFKIGRAHV